MSVSWTFGFRFCFWRFGLSFWSSQVKGSIHPCVLLNHFCILLHDSIITYRMLPSSRLWLHYIIHWSIVVLKFIIWCFCVNIQIFSSFQHLFHKWSLFYICYQVFFFLYSFIRFSHNRLSWKVKFSVDLWFGKFLFNF